ncbi:DUF484 family protein [Mangrovicoccus algicola]|uniref:DUF484 family protein n=1 Tax=Mangrovicoccus algicola TaxID=2771008 RepID=A0A8J7CGZ6_9RHOB|nr:DUF484 family protein [Mangrovicoccus algicola]MBE3637695.1 DUF484 family protein [Mangrovicoccus algicola]
MTQTDTATAVKPDVRDQILTNPSAVLEDTELMAALIAADDGLRGGNVIDLRGLAIARLEDRLARLETTHQTVISAAYDNVSTTSQVHRAILAMIAPLQLEAFLDCLGSDVADILRAASIRILVEGRMPMEHPVLVPVGTGDITRYIDSWRSGRPVPVALRRVPEKMPRLHDESRGPVASEALFRLELGDTAPPALLAIGSADADQYLPGHATDLLTLFGRCCERTLRGLIG